MQFSPEIEDGLSVNNLQALKGKDISFINLAAVTLTKRLRQSGRGYRRSLSKTGSLIAMVPRQGRNEITLGATRFVFIIVFPFIFYYDDSRDNYTSGNYDEG